MKARLFVQVFVVILLTGVASNAKAQTKTGWGISTTIGSGSIRDQDGTETFSGNGFGFSAEVEYRFTPNFALGFGGFSLGRADDTFNGVDTTIQVRGYEFFGRLIYPTSDRVDVYGRLGAASYSADIDPGSVSISDALFGQEAVDIGIGVDFHRKSNLALRLEGRYMNGSKEETGALLSIGINYLF